METQNGEMQQREELMKQYAAMLAAVEEKQNELRKLNKEYENQRGVLRAVHRANKNGGKAGQNGALSEQHLAELKCLRNRCWQHECSSIILQKENLAIKNQYDKREFLVKLGILEIRLRKLGYKWAKHQKQRDQMSTDANRNSLNSPGHAAQTGDGLTTMEDEEERFHKEMYMQLRDMYIDLRTMYSNVQVFMEKANKSFQRRPDESEAVMPASDK